MPVPVVITAYGDRTFTFITKTPPNTYFLMKAAKIDKGSTTAGQGRHRRPRHHDAAARDRGAEDEGHERQRRRGRGAHARRLRPVDGPDRGGGLSHGARTSGCARPMRPFDRNKLYPLADAVSWSRATPAPSSTRRSRSSMNLGIDPRHADQMVRGLISLPNGTGKTLRIGVFARGAEGRGGDRPPVPTWSAPRISPRRSRPATSSSTAASRRPDMMALVGRLGKILGPRGLMPNPRLGTVTMDVKDAVAAAKAGQVEFRAEKAGIIHAGIGKASFDGRQAAGEHPRARRCRAEGASRPAPRVPMCRRCR